MYTQIKLCENKMKQTTQRLLLSLYSQTDQVVQFPYALSELLLLELTPGGRRSLLYLLENQGLIYKESLAGQLTLTISQEGREAIEAVFPSLQIQNDSWQGGWIMLSFLTAPDRDKNFRYLRKALVQANALPISRGAYAFPNKLPEALAWEIGNLYTGNVLVSEISSEQAGGTLRSKIIEHYHLPDLISAYSGISTEIQQLLKQNRNLERLTDKQKSSIAAVLTRIVELGAQDLGIIRYYYPNSINLKKLIEMFQQLLTQVFDS